MHAETMQAHLAAAEEHIKKADYRITIQEERIQKLPLGSSERQKAEDFLKYLRDLKVTMENHRELIREGLRTRLKEERFGTSFG
jgi:hypothetical protein